MSKFYAEIKDGIVINVVIAERKADLYDDGNKWIETFADGSKRTHYASIGGSYDSENDVFYAEKPNGYGKHQKHNQTMVRITFGMKLMVSGKKLPLVVCHKYGYRKK